MAEFNKVTNHQCAGKGCPAIIDAGLTLRFCPKCRAQQPLPTKNRKRYEKKSA